MEWRCDEPDARRGKDKDNHNLTVLCACREVKQDHQLSNYLRELDMQGVAITDIVLSNISGGALKDHLSTMLGGEKEAVEPLSNLLYQITGGNHLFIHQVVSLMLTEGLLYKQGDLWEWKEEEVQDRLQCEDVLSFVAAKLRKESPVVQEFLMLGSCLGNGLDEYVLEAGLTSDNGATVAEMLSETADQGYLVQCNQWLWSFAHDQIQHAAHDLIPTDEKQQFHLALGRRLLKRLSTEALDWHYILVARQVLHGSSLITNEADRLDTSFFFLEAGKRAGQASSFEEAVSFFNVAIDLLPNDHWKSQYDLSLELYNGAAEIECALGNFDHVDRLLAKAISHEMDIDDKMRSYTTQIVSLGSRSRLDEAIAKVQDMLREAGFPLPKKVTKMRLLLELARTKACLCGMSAVGFALYASLLCATGSVHHGYEVGMAALRTLDRFNAREWRCRVLIIVTNFVMIWKDPMSELLKISQNATRIGLDTGDTEFAMLSLGLDVQQGFETSPSLEPLFSRMKASRELMDRYEQTAISAAFAPCTQSVANILGQY